MPMTQKPSPTLLRNIERNSEKLLSSIWCAIVAMVTTKAMSPRFASSCLFSSSTDDMSTKKAWSQRRRLRTLTYTKKETCIFCSRRWSKLKIFPKFNKLSRVVRQRKLSSF